MKSIIEEIYLGKCGIQSSVKTSEEYNEIIKKVINHYEDLENQLSEKQRAMLEELNCEMGELSAEHSMTNFKAGFKLGILIAFEALFDR